MFKFQYKVYRKEVNNDVKKSAITSLFKVGAIVSKLAKKSIKQTTRSVVTTRIVSGKRVRSSGRGGRFVSGRRYGGEGKAGEHYNTRRGLSRRAIAFVVDKNEPAVYVGSQASIIGNIAEIQEKGLTVKRMNHGKMKDHVYPKRPVMRRALGAAGRLNNEFSFIL